jgi:predicted PhzF superfamily epimerase YddE/YHI9
MAVPARRRKQGRRRDPAPPAQARSLRRGVRSVRSQLGLCLLRARWSRPPAAFHARTFAPCWRIFKDPAAAAFAGVLLRFAPPPDGDHALTLEQGYELGRPSLITLSLTVRNRRLAGAAISGDAVAVSEGTIET